MNPTPAGSHWEQYARDHAHFRGQYPQWLDAISEPPSEGWIIDVGASDGGVTEWLTRRFPACRILAMDISWTRCQRCRDGSGVMVVQADAAALPIDRGVADVVITNQLVEHVPDDRQVVEECARLVKPGGWLLVGSVIHPKIRWYFYRNQEGIAVLDPTHLREYAHIDDLIALIPLEFEIRQCIGVTPRASVWHAVVRLLVRWMPGVGQWLMRRRSSGWWRWLGRRTALPLLGYQEMMVVAQRGK